MISSKEILHHIPRSVRIPVAGGLALLAAFGFQPENNMVYSADQPQQSIPTELNAEGNITICHRTDAVNNPYVEITVDIHAVDGIAGNSGQQPDHFGEHQGPLASSLKVAQALKNSHTEWGDIIPPVLPYHNGLNWSDGGDMLKNGCNFVTPPDTPTPTATATETITPTKTATLTPTTTPRPEETPLPPTSTPGVEKTPTPTLTPTPTATKEALPMPKELPKTGDPLVPPTLSLLGLGLAGLGFHLFRSRQQ